MEQAAFPSMIVVPAPRYDFSFLIPRIAMPHSISFPYAFFSWNSLKSRCERWGKTHFIRPSFRIRFILPTFRFSGFMPSIQLVKKNYETTPFLRSPETIDASQKMVEREKKRIGLRNRFIPQFQIKFQLPHACPWPSVLTPRLPQISKAQFHIPSFVVRLTRKEKKGIKKFSGNSENMFAVLPVLAPENRIPSVNLFTPDRNKTMSFLPILLYGAMAGAFFLGVCVNMF